MTLKHFSLLEQPTRKAIKVFTERRNFTKQKYISKNFVFPQEDYFRSSSKYPIFAIADGVTLDIKKLIEREEVYPNLSPAGEVARIFCEMTIESAEDKFKNFSHRSIKEVFEEGNRAVKKYNQQQGKSKVSGNITGFYSCTGAFAVIKEGKVYWASICDAYFAHFDKNMNPKHISSGVCSPYAVINGEARMTEQIESGIRDIEKGDRIFVFTDGFANYFRDSKFLGLFKSWSEELESEIEALTSRMAGENPEKYGHERAFTAIFTA